MPAKKTDVVAKSNRLIQASYKLDLMEQRILLFGIMKARESGKTPNELAMGFVTIEAREFAEKFDISEKYVYDQLKTAARTLFRRELIIRDIDPETKMERVNQTRWLSTASYIDGAGRVQIQFPGFISSHILRLDGAYQPYTKYQLEQVGKLNSVYAVRIYELLSQYLSVGERAFSINELREILSFSEDEYKSLSNLKIRVVDPAMEQISERTDLNVHYTHKKHGRTITHFVFHISPRQEKKEKKPEKKKEGKEAPAVKKAREAAEQKLKSEMAELERQGQKRLELPK